MGPWEVIEQAMARRKPARDQQWLAEQLGIGPQAITNWKTRGVPPARFRDLANLFGLSVDQVEGLEPPPWAKQFEWPFSTQLQERLEKMRSEEICALEKAMWDHIREKPPAVVEAQLKKALQTAEKHGMHGLSVKESAANTRKTPTP